MKIYVITQVFDYEDSEIVKVFESEKQARDFVRRNFNIKRYDDTTIKNLIDNAIVYYWTETDEVLIQELKLEKEDNKK